MSATSRIRPRTAHRGLAHRAALTCVRTTTTITWIRARPPAKRWPGRTRAPTAPPALRLLLRQRQLDRLRHHPQQAPRRNARLAELRLRQRPAMVRRCAAGLPHDVADARRHRGAAWTPMAMSRLLQQPGHRRDRVLAAPVSHPRKWGPAQCDGTQHAEDLQRDHRLQGNLAGNWD